MRSKAPPNGCALFTCVAIKGGTEGGGSPISTRLRRAARDRGEDPRHVSTRP